jgi:predicted metal-dependent HD superfamily phosphohydrolase
MELPGTAVDKACEYFATLMLSLGNPVGSKEILKKLLTYYSEPHRYYHTLTHIVAMLTEFGKISSVADTPHAISFAIWYNDVIYDTKLVEPNVLSNEERSALLSMEDLFVIGMSDSFSLKVYDLILATNHSGKNSSNWDVQILLDLDLAILGSNQYLFDEYERNIRKEYSGVPDALYKQKRLEVLMKFYNREPLYLTQLFRKKYEVIAKMNLERSMKSLSS